MSGSSFVCFVFPPGYGSVSGPDRGLGVGLGLWLGLSGGIMVQQIRPQVTAQQGGKVSRLALAVVSGVERRGTLPCWFVPRSLALLLVHLVFCIRLQVVECCSLAVLLLQAGETPYVYLLCKG